MKTGLLLVLLLATLLAPFAAAQKWEFGGSAGGGFHTSQDVSGPAGNGSATITPGFAAGTWLANNINDRWAGEMRYDFQMGDLRVSQQSASASFASMSHAFHYDLLFHFAPREAKVRPFVALGGGVKVYQGTGKEVAAQPLNSLALLTKTSQLEGLASVGAGLKFNYRRVGFRVEVHDYATPFPAKVIAPAQNAKIGGWIHDLVLNVGVGMLF